MGDYDHYKNERTTIEKFLERDYHRCGIHIGGCLENLNPDEDEIEKDHIIPKRWYLAPSEVATTRIDNRRRRLFNQDWNIQPMHAICNTQREFDRFPKFTCKCHRMMIDDGVLYVVAWEQPYELPLPARIPTSDPGQLSTISTARPRRIKGEKTDDGRQLYRTDIIGGNAVSLPAVYEGDVAFFNEVAATNPTDISKYRWNGMPRVNNRGEVEHLELTPSQGAVLVESLDQRDLEIFFKLRRVLWLNLSSAIPVARIYCLHGRDGYPGLISRTEMDRLAELSLVRLLPAEQVSIPKTTTFWLVGYGGNRYEVSSTKHPATLRWGRWNLTSGGRFLVDHYRDEKVEPLMDHFDFNVNAWSSEGFETRERNIYVALPHRRHPPEI